MCASCTKIPIKVNKAKPVLQSVLVDSSVSSSSKSLVRCSFVPAIDRLAVFISVITADVGNVSIEKLHLSC